jgi:SulP family sulfate permease
MLAALLFMKRMSEAVSIQQQTHGQLAQETNNENFILPSNVAVYAMEGPFFFGAAESLMSALQHVHSHADILVLRMGQVPIIDATGLQTLWDLIDTCEHNNTRLMLCEVRPNILEKIKRAGIAQKVGQENIVENIQALKI